jgi:hypothetical protein
MVARRDGWAVFALAGSDHMAFNAPGDPSGGTYIVTATSLTRGHEAGTIALTVRPHEGMAAAQDEHGSVPNPGGRAPSFAQAGGNVLEELSGLSFPLLSDAGNALGTEDQSTRQAHAYQAGRSEAGR